MRAKSKKLEFTITVKDITIPEICPILGITLERAPYGTRASQPQSPTLDRIDSSKGYRRGNVQVISRRANMIKSDATLDEIVLAGQWAQRAREGLVVLT
jgi:hypothetical protein